MTTADLIVLGAGPGGYTTAARAAAGGAAVILFEPGELGGTCLNRGCIPTKALCRSAEVAVTVASASRFGVSVEGPVALSWPVASVRKDEVVATLREGVATLLRNVTVVRERASFTPSGTIMAGGEEYSAPKIVIATGSRPAPLRAEGADLAVSSDELLSLPDVPESVAIVGGGVIGMEFASILAAFGVKVTVLEYCPEILPPFDAEIAKRLRMAMKRRGVNIVTGASVTAIRPGFAVDYEAKGKKATVEAALVLSAVGRRPVLPDGLEEAGIKVTPRGYIKVDDNMLTTRPGVYAIGDVNGLCMLAHAAEAQGAVALGEDIDLSVIPSAVFTMPECAMVGLTEKECQDLGYNIKVGKAIFRSNGKALAIDEPDGLVKVITDTTTGRMLGCHICGPHAADLIQEAALAIAAGIPSAGVALTVHGHPTLSETLLQAVAASL